MSNGDSGGLGPPAPADISIQVFDIAPPAVPTDIPRQHLDAYFRDTYTILKDYGIPNFIATLLAGTIVGICVLPMIIAHLAILLIKPVLPAIGGTIFEVLDDLRKTLDPQFAQFAVAVLNELLGTDFDVTHLPQGTDINAHLARAEEVGFLFHRQLLSEFLQNSGLSLDPTSSAFSEVTGPTGAGERITPMSGVRAAARFSGLAINFGTATGIIATLGGLAPFVHLDEIREIGEEVAKNLGLGRLQRLALAPIVQILLAEPYKWFINEIARPTQFKLGDVINPFSGALMPADLIWTSLAREGYSDNKITALLELHRKKLTESDLSTLFAAGHIDTATLQQRLQRLGYSDTDSQDKAEADRLDKVRTYYEELRSAAVQAYADGHIPRDELQGIVNGLPLTDEDKAYIMLAADYKRKVPTKHLTTAQLEKAFEVGIIDLADYTNALTTLGYSDADQSTLLLLTLLALDKQKEAAAAKAAAAAAKAAAAAAKAAKGTTPTVP